MKTIIQQTICVNNKLKIGSYQDKLDSHIAFNSPWVAFMVGSRKEAAVLGGYVAEIWKTLSKIKTTARV